MAVIGDAARRGDAEAAYVCAMLAAQDAALPRRFEIALNHIRDAADRGLARALSEAALLAAAGLDGLSSARPQQEISSSPRIAAVADCAPDAVCDWLIADTVPRLGRAQVYDPAHGGARQEDARSNSAAAFDVARSNLVLMLLRQRIAATAGSAVREPGSAADPALCGRAGVQPHVDFLDPLVRAMRATSAGGAARRHLLIYLNDGYEGGETEFPRLGIRHKARKGDGLLFWNVDEDGHPDQRMLHAGLPPTRGEKWVLSQWLRAR